MARFWVVLVAFVLAGGGCGSSDSESRGSSGGSGGVGGSGVGGSGAGGSGGGIGGGGAGGNLPIQQVRSGRHHTCTRLLEGDIYCWGQGAFRALGGDYNAQHTPRLVEAIPDAVSIDSGARYGCAIRESGEVWCWGDSGSNQVGTNATIPCGDCTPLPDCATSMCVPAPQPMAGLESGVVELALGEDHGCARRDDGSVVCWGANAHGQLADPDLGLIATSPQAISGVTGASGLTTGVAHTCALMGIPGQVMCWGRNDRAEVGNGEVSDVVTAPATVADLDDAVEVVAGGSHTCARRASGAVVCWGYNYLGALGNGSTSPTRATSIQEVVNLTDAVALAAGDYFTCALRTTGAVVCWGDNGHGQLGDGTAAGADCSGRDCRTSPVEVLVVKDAVIVNAGHLHACAADGAGRLWCWGYNLGGQVGTGSVSSDPIATPVEVAGLPL